MFSILSKPVGQGDHTNLFIPYFREVLSVWLFLTVWVVFFLFFLLWPYWLFKLLILLLYVMHSTSFGHTLISLYTFQFLSAVSSLPFHYTRFHSTCWFFSPKLLFCNPVSSFPPFGFTVDTILHLTRLKLQCKALYLFCKLCLKYCLELKHSAQ